MHTATLIDMRPIPLRESVQPVQLKRLSWPLKKGHSQLLQEKKVDLAIEQRHLQQAEASSAHACGLMGEGSVAALACALPATACAKGMMSSCRASTPQRQGVCLLPPHMRHEALSKNVISTPSSYTAVTCNPHARRRPPSLRYQASLVPGSCSSGATCRVTQGLRRIMPLFPTATGAYRSWDRHAGKAANGR